ncbi:hypothetical protein [Methanoculleus sp. UBA208]|uniref:hypothetical protein n=1 Tax=Methanoculleus sp. UBA208 TaxID=1915494 RepID=UPI0025E6F316|nr:hypothetical protein [Methanoculleus sp. UBA208]
MKTKFLSGIRALLAALLIVSTIFVAAVSANEDTLENIPPSGGDPVDRDVVLERSPHLFDDAGNRLSDREISQMIEEMPEISYLDGMSESESRELAERLRQLHKYRSVADRIASGVSSQSASVRADPGLGIDQRHFNGINVSNYPEDLRDQGSTTSAAKLQSSQPAFTDPGVERLKAALNRREPVTVTLGGLPISKGGKGIALSNFTTATEDLIRERYLYPNGSLIGFGYDIDSYLRVGIWNGPPPPKNVSSIEAVYTMLDERAQEMGIEDIPVKFTVFISPPELVLGPQMDSSEWMRLCSAA